MARLNQAGIRELQRRLDALALKGAEAAADVLRDKLSGPGTGRQHPGLPNRSSAQGEYPAEQTGQLKASVGARPGEQGGAVFGLLDPPDYAAALHFKPPTDGGRPVMLDALNDEDIRRAIRQAVGP